MRPTLTTVVAMATMLLVLLGVPAHAGDGAEQISGVGTGVVECNGQTSLITLEIDGSLDGCWHTTSIPYTKWNPESGVHQERGTERFEGC